MLENYLFMLFWSQLVLTLVSCYPFDLRRGLRSPGLYIPGVAIIIMSAYERLMYVLGYDIRVDLIILMPAIAFTIGVGCVRWLLLGLMYFKIPKSTGKLIQFWAILIIGICCFAWFYLTWNYPLGFGN